MKLALPFGLSTQILIFSILSSLMTTTHGCGTEVGNGFAPIIPEDSGDKDDVTQTPDKGVPQANPLPDDGSKVEAGDYAWSKSNSLSWENLQAEPSFLLTSCNGPLQKIISDAGEVTHFELSSGDSTKKINLIKTATEKWQIFSDSDLKYSFELQEALVETFDENSKPASLLNCAAEIDTLATDAEFIEHKPFTSAELGSGLSFDISSRSFYMYWVYAIEGHSTSDIEIYDRSSQTKIEISVRAK